MDRPTRSTMKLLRVSSWLVLEHDETGGSILYSPCNVLAAQPTIADQQRGYMYIVYQYGSLPPTPSPGRGGDLEELELCTPLDIFDQSKIRMSRPVIRLLLPAVFAVVSIQYDVSV